ncbi:uncharacterized protein BP5553_04252 [Venustampulla echinocandica]|uniref:Uncharacterized protein n=1 Tax=Venustampulla echinocandica TaxID=2656787 RepID=A0A370TWK8_9HELO|nr:uncharacterized protein BP5553_04252 [Venustampulla echinocandica]RDL39912.1 hypothetical protein BP5553_04252 [Venustampulla echinocandica]
MDETTSSGSDGVHKPAASKMPRTKKEWEAHMAVPSTKEEWEAYASLFRDIYAEGKTWNESLAKLECFALNDQKARAISGDSDSDSDEYGQEEKGIAPERDIGDVAYEGSEEDETIQEKGDIQRFDFGIPPTINTEVWDSDEDISEYNDDNYDEYSEASESPADDSDLDEMDLDEIDPVLPESSSFNNEESEDGDEETGSDMSALSHSDSKGTGDDDDDDDDDNDEDEDIEMNDQDIQIDDEDVKMDDVFEQ